MILYWVLLLVTALIAYFFGSLDVMVISSNFIFHRSLYKLGKSGAWLSNFRRVYGIGGFIRLLLVELVRDAVPILIGGLLLSVNDHAVVGRAFAGFCLVLGRLYPIFYSFRGSHAILCLVVSAFFVDASVGAAALVMLVLVTLVSRFLSLGAIVGAATCAVVAVMVLDDTLLMRLVIFSAALVLIKHIPALIRIFKGVEPKLSLQEDITYKLDDKF